MTDHRDTGPAPLQALRDARPSPSVEQRIVDGAMGRALAPRRRRLAPVVFAAATAAAAVWLFTRPAETPQTTPAAPTSTALQSAPAPPVEVRHRMTHGKDAVFQVETPSPDRTEVQLTAGQAQFEVEPLPPGGIFAVQTPHARIEVVGTAFTIDVSGGCSAVSVSEGRVRVRQGDAVRFVSAGERHRACPRAAAGERQVQSGLAHLVAGRTAEGVAELERYVAAHPRGPLAEEALYHLALAADRAGDAAALERAVSRYLERFPRSARAERVRGLWALPPK